jgi:hypothetical protein
MGVAVALVWATAARHPFHLFIGQFAHHFIGLIAHDLLPYWSSSPEALSSPWSPGGRISLTLGALLSRSLA